MFIKQRLKRGEYLCGTFLSIKSTEIAEMISRAGFDFVIIDAEHCSYDWSEIENLIRAVSYNGAASIVRVPGIFRPLILRALDLGAEGILVPRVDTPQDAREVVQFAKYPPLGDRGFAGIVRAAEYGQIPVGQYIEQANENILIAVQAETAKAVDNLEEIVEVDGIDMIFVGPSDLSVSLGFAGKPNASQVRERIEKINTIAKNKGVLSGIYVGNVPDMEMWLKKGFQFMATGTTGLIRLTLKQLEIDMHDGIKKMV